MTSAPRPLAPAPTGLSPSEGMPWPRLGMGLMLLVVSLAMSWHAGRHTPLAAPPAVAQPVLDRLVTGAPLAPLPRFARPTRAAFAGTARPDPVRSATRAAAGEPLRLAKRHRTHRRIHPRALASATARTPGASPWSIGHDQAAAVKFTRRRGEVRRDYLAARERVTALTGEDSGSAFLAREAARMRRTRAGGTRDRAAAGGSA